VATSPSAKICVSTGEAQMSGRGRSPTSHAERSGTPARYSLCGCTQKARKQSGHELGPSWARSGRAEGRRRLCRQLRPGAAQAQLNAEGADARDARHRGAAVLARNCRTPRPGRPMADHQLQAREPATSTSVSAPSGSGAPEGDARRASTGLCQHHDAETETLPIFLGFVRNYRRTEQTLTTGSAMA